MRSREVQTTAALADEWEQTFRADLVADTAVERRLFGRAVVIVAIIAMLMALVAVLS